jgi:hypothetical protein
MDCYLRIRPDLGCLTISGETRMSLAAVQFGTTRHKSEAQCFPMPVLGLHRSDRAN